MSIGPDMLERAGSTLAGASACVARFRDRQDAGGRLAAMLDSYVGEAPIVLALPRGGVPVGYEVARRLHAHLDVLVVRKVGVPWDRELGVGAVAEGGYVYISPETVAAVGLGKRELATVIDRERAEVQVRVRRYRGGRVRPELRGRTIILVDDGIATGGTVRAALRAIRAARPREVVLAVPVASPDVLESLSREVDRIVCPLVPADLCAIGRWYQNFRQVDDDEVARLLENSRQNWTASCAETSSTTSLVGLPTWGSLCRLDLSA